MIILFLTLVLVYIIFYNFKEETLKSQFAVLTQTFQTGENNVIPSTSEDGFDVIGEQFSWTNISWTQNNSSSTESSTWKIFDSLFENSSTTTWKITEKIQTWELWNILLLSGTQMYYGEFEIANLLSINPLYILYDPKGIYYAYLGTQEKDWRSIVKLNKGSITELRKKEDLLKNNLFGNKVIFINIPKYKNKEVIMIITLGKDQWLINIPFGIYHKSKNYLKSVFSL